MQLYCLGPLCLSPGPSDGDVEAIVHTKIYANTSRRFGITRVPLTYPVGTFILFAYKPISPEKNNGDKVHDLITGNTVRASNLHNKARHAFRNGGNKALQYQIP